MTALPTGNNPSYIFRSRTKMDQSTQVDFPIVVRKMKRHNTSADLYVTTSRGHTNSWVSVSNTPRQINNRLLTGNGSVDVTLTARNFQTCNFRVLWVIIGGQFFGEFIGTVFAAS